MALLVVTWQETHPLPAMKPAFLKLLLPLVLCTATARAQHCPFDNACILVVRPVDAQTGLLIEDITMSIQDSSGRILEDWNGQKLVLVPNPQRTDTAWFPYNHNLVRYSFAAGNYIRVLSCTLNTAARPRLVIEDSSARRTTHYKRIELPLTPAHLYSLHNNVGNWTLLRNNVETPSPQEPFDKLITIHCKQDN